MKNSKLIIILFITLLILIVSYFAVKNGDKQNYYKLNSKVYLEKIDYFSKYKIVNESGNNYLLLATDINAISILENGYLIKFKDNDAIKYMFVYKFKEEYIVGNSINDFEALLNRHELGWKKPWQIVESLTLSNSTKLINQILLILIITLSLYIIMKVFNLKKIIKNP